MGIRKGPCIRQGLFTPKIGGKSFRDAKNHGELQQERGTSLILSGALAVHVVPGEREIHAGWRVERTSLCAHMRCL